MKLKCSAPYLCGLLFIFMLSGCVVRTYPVTKDRIDQDLSSGNRGYLQGQASTLVEKERKPTRTTQVVEIEIGSPIKFEKAPKPKISRRQLFRTEDESLTGNRGYITQSITPQIPEPQVSVPVSFENYKVQKNDTLQKISQKFYGTTKRWQKIYEANKDRLKAPDKIYVGQVLQIPVESASEIKENLK